MRNSINLRWSNKLASRSFCKRKRFKRGDNNQPIVAWHIVIVHSLFGNVGSIRHEHGASISPLNRCKRNADGTAPVGRITRKKRNGIVSNCRGKGEVESVITGVFTTERFNCPWTLAAVLCRCGVTLVPRRNSHSLSFSPPPHPSLALPSPCTARRNAKSFHYQTRLGSRFCGRPTAEGERERWNSWGRDGQIGALLCSGQKPVKTIRSKYAVNKMGFRLKKVDGIVKRLYVTSAKNMKI